MDRIKTKTPLTAAKKKEAVKKLVFTALMFIFVYIMIFPLLWMVSSSLKSSDEYSAFRFNGFRKPFGGPTMQRCGIINTILLAECF